MARLFDDASSQYLTLAAAPVASLPITVSAWFYTDDVTISVDVLSLVGATDQHLLLCRVLGATAGDPLDCVYRGAAGGATTIITGNGVTVNTWHHYAATIDASANMSIWLDADDGNKDTDTGADTSVTWTTTEIGEDARAATNKKFSGRIAEVAVWNVALSYSEIAALSKRVSPDQIRPSDLASGGEYWKLLQSDKGHFGNYDMTPVNSPTWADHPPMRYPEDGWSSDDMGYGGEVAGPGPAAIVGNRVAVMVGG